MDFEFSKEQATLRDVARSMLASTCTPEFVRSTFDGGHGLDLKLWERGVELGWTMLAVPEEHDGAGAGLVELCIVAEELGRAVAPGPWLDTALTAHAIANAGVRQEILERLLTGESKAAVVDSKRSGLVHAAADADYLLVLAPDRAVLVDADQAIVQRRKTLDQSRQWYAVTPPSSEGTTLATGPEAQRLLDAAAVLVSADALGVGERLLEMTVAYASVREQFGRPIGSFQVVKHSAADMLSLLKGVRASTYFAAMSLDAARKDGSKAASIAKAFASESVPSVAGQALQTHGGIGFTWEHDLHLYLRRAKIDEELFGNAAFHHERIAMML